jgi:uncharacterized protein
MLFEWDERKSRINLRKHGVDFETAVLAFSDSNLFLEEDQIDESGEQRWSALGLAGPQVLMVVHVYRSTENGEEIIRIISARKASAAQCRRYSE